MELFDKLPKEDVDLIQEYINWFGGSEEAESYMPRDRMNYFLRFWSETKAPLYKMFGDQFILRKEICFNKDPDILEEEMEEELRYGSSISQSFRNTYSKVIDEKFNDFDIRYELKRFVSDYTMLVKNEYDGAPFCIPGILTIDGKPLQINRGVKAVKMLGKIANALGIKVTRYVCPNCGSHSDIPEPKCPYCYCDQPYEVKDGYETFRQLHSQVLNQKRIRGNLCLSIHPMDYITMSDNNSGWSSCMQWVEERGDYRLGTLEMMNSPYCVVAYIEAKDPMSICHEKIWSNKRWRQLLMITPDILVGNKQYPYFNDDLQGAALTWLRDLANNCNVVSAWDNRRYGPYDNEAIQMRNGRENIVGIRRIRIDLYFDYMYNDIYDNRMAFISRSYTGNSISYNLSGHAICTNCGEIIENDSDGVDPSWTVCRDCCGMWRCSDCGDWQYGDPYYPEDSDYPMCEYCYRNNTTVCEVCGDHVVTTTSLFIEILPDANEEDEYYNWNFVVDVCQNCLYGDDLEELYGPIEHRNDMYGRTRKVVLLKNITDEGIDRGGANFDTREMLKSIRDLNTNKERIEFLRKNYY